LPVQAPESQPADKIPAIARRNIEAVVRLEQEVLLRRSRLDRASDAISAFVGSIRFVLAHALAIAAWVAVNAGAVPGVLPFDPYPFALLNLTLAAEAVLFSTFVLMSQNRQSHQANRRAHLDLQVSLLAEQEATRTLQMLRQICDRLGLEQAAGDTELHELTQATHVSVLAQGLSDAHDADEVPAAREPIGDS
jgi:uncharacterized membrane protein